LISGYKRDDLGCTPILFDSQQTAQDSSIWYQYLQAFLRELVGLYLPLNMGLPADNAKKSGAKTAS
jgi:hypothetical protein